jgi:hypothetical protein
MKILYFMSIIISITTMLFSCAFDDLPMISIQYVSKNSNNLEVAVTRDCYNHRCRQVVLIESSRKLNYQLIDELVESNFVSKDYHILIDIVAISNTAYSLDNAVGSTGVKGMEVFSIPLSKFQYNKNYYYYAVGIDSTVFTYIQIDKKFLI